MREREKRKRLPQTLWFWKSVFVHEHSFLLARYGNVDQIFINTSIKPGMLCICMGIPDKCFGLIFISIMLEQHYDLSRKETSQASLEFHPFKLLLEIEQPRLHCILLGMTAWRWLKNWTVCWVKINLNITSVLNSWLKLPWTSNL